MHSDTAKWRAEARYFEFDGNQIAYWQGGSGKPLLLVHGFPTCAWDWTSVWERLGERHSLIACDMLGFGLSDKPRKGFNGRGYSIHRQTDLQEALLSHLGVTEWDALVHDYGVSVGQELLARHEECSGASGLGKMVFLNGGIFPDQHDGFFIEHRDDDYGPEPTCKQALVDPLLAIAEFQLETLDVVHTARIDSFPLENFW